ncbi:MAG: glycosyltransferase, partial [Planctomycetia bacterium]
RQPCDAPWVTGAAILIRRALLEALGGMDETYFLYYEDVDLCRRAWRAGFSVRFEPGPTLRHLYPYHSRALTHRMVYLSRRAMLVYFRKNRPRWEFHALAGIVRLEGWFRATLENRQGVASPGWNQLRADLEAVLQNPDDPPLRRFPDEEERNEDPRFKNHPTPEGGETSIS